MLSKGGEKLSLSSWIAGVGNWSDIKKTLEALEPDARRELKPFIHALVNHFSGRGLPINYSFSQLPELAKMLSTGQLKEVITYCIKYADDFKRNYIPFWAGFFHSFYDPVPSSYIGNAAEFISRISSERNVDISLLGGRNLLELAKQAVAAKEKGLEYSFDVIPFKSHKETVTRVENADQYGINTYTYEESVTVVDQEQAVSLRLKQGDEAPAKDSNFNLVTSSFHDTFEELKHNWLFSSISKKNSGYPQVSIEEDIVRKIAKLKIELPSIIDLLNQMKITNVLSIFVMGSSVWSYRSKDIDLLIVTEGEKTPELKSGKNVRIAGLPVEIREIGIETIKQAKRNVNNPDYKVAVSQAALIYGSAIRLGGEDISEITKPDMDSLKILSNVFSENILRLKEKEGYSDKVKRWSFEKEAADKVISGEIQI